MGLDMGAFEQAWSLLKALPGQQIVDTMGDMRTMNPIIARLARDSADPLGLSPQVSLQSGYTGSGRNQGVINTRPERRYDDDNYDSYVDDYGNLQYAHMMNNSGDRSRFGVLPQFQTDLSNPFSPFYVRHDEKGTPHELLREGLTNFNITTGRGPDNYLRPFRQEYTPVTPEQVVNPEHFPFDTPLREREPTEKLLTDSAKFNYAIENS